MAPCPRTRANKAHVSDSPKSQGFWGSPVASCGGRLVPQSAKISSTAFDRAFDTGKDVTGALDMGQARRPLRETRRVNVDFPIWMIESLDREAERLGVTRQAIIKVWIAERLSVTAGS
jgi:hypothetical protein